MFGMFNSLSTAARKRIEYNRTVAELSRLSGSTRRDLAIEEKHIRKLAREAVYGV